MGMRRSRIDVTGNPSATPHATAAMLDTAVEPERSWIDREDRLTFRDLALDVFIAMRIAAPQPPAACAERK